MSRIPLLCRSSRFFELHCACNWLHIVGAPLHLPGAQCPLPVLRPQVNFTFLSIHWELNVLSVFFTHKWISTPCSFNSCPLLVHRVSCSLLQRKPKEDPDLTEKVAPLPSLLLWRYLVLFQFWPISDIFQLCHSHFSQMENVLLSTGLPFASDFASHLNKITQDDHCKYGNTSIAMEI